VLGVVRAVGLLLRRRVSSARDEQKAAVSLVRQALAFHRRQTR
jgi:hypothetical protein